MRNVPIAWRMLVSEGLRSGVTALGIGFSVGLVLFLASLSNGVREESNGYVEHVDADVWVTQRSARNLMRSASFVPEALNETLLGMEDVSAVAGILRTIATARVGDREATLMVYGVEPEAWSGTPEIVAGTASLDSGEIILDRAFAARHRVAIGDILTIQDEPFTVSGLSRGTNALVAQFAFLNLADAQDLLGFRAVVSFFAVRTTPGADRVQVASVIRDADPSLNAYPGEVFIRNNLEEMQTGVLPLLSTVTVFGSLIGALILTLLIYGFVLERREDFAVLKAIGASQAFIGGIVVRQALIAVMYGFGVGLLLFALVKPLLLRLAPEITLLTPPSTVGLVLLGALVLGLLGSWLPLRKLRGIYPAEVFRA
jgi:putative ABC transport system permease protein